MSGLPAQPSLRRMKAFGIRPNRDLGQNFLIDSNLLDVIGREAELAADDVVLEVGGGLGVLSEYLAARVAHVHVVEVDPRLEPALRDALDPHPNATLHFADAVRLDLSALDPAPTKVVANLPYGVAATMILRVVEELPGVETQVAMVQREVGERLAAKPGSTAYGAPSVLAQLACEVRVLRPVSRNVFHPVPNVDSVLVGLRRTAPPPEPGLRALVSAGFAHRRKALPGSLALAGFDRDRARAALESIGLRPDARAETLGPDRWRELYGALKESRVGAHPSMLSVRRPRLITLRARAPAKVNLCLFVGEPRADGLHPLVSVVQALSLADELTLEPASGDADEVVCPGVEGPNLAARALALFREATGWDGPPQRLTIAKRIPVAAGMGGGSSDAAAALRLAAHASGLQIPAELGPRLGADVPSLMRPGRVLMTGAGEHVDRLPDPPPLGVLVLPVDAALSTPEVYRAADRLGLTRSHAELAEIDARVRAAPAGHVHNDLQDGARSLCPKIDAALDAARRAGADHALVSGSGPTVVGLFLGAGGPARAREAAPSWPRAVAAEPVGETWAEVRG